VPDWRKLVAEKLNGTDLPPLQRQEIAAELASHLEEAFEEQRAQGVPESEAVGRALSEVVDWNELARRIRRTKHEEGTMNDRTRHLWLPGLASLSAAIAVEVVLAQLSYRPHMILRAHVTQLMYALWLVAQPVCGAVGAYFSRRAGGTRPARLAAGLFPSGILLAAVLIVISINLTLRATGLGSPELGPVSVTMFSKAITTVILVPAGAMLLGALPFLSDRRRAAPETIGVA
jgi:hypothetical protein